MVVTIKELPELERPYEKLEHYGVSNLSNEELLAILLRTGYKNISAKELASQLLSHLSSLDELSEIRYERLVRMKGIGRSKAATVLAAMELFRRVEKAKTEIQGMSLTSSQKVFDYYRLKIGHQKQEHFYVVYLDNAKKIIRDKLLFIGTINYSIVHPREVFKEAYLLSASAIICVHNHPSGNVFPSREDIELTHQLEKVGVLLGIKVLDHLIIGKEKYYSFLENGDMERSQVKE